MQEVDLLKDVGGIGRTTATYDKTSSKLIC